MSKKICICGSMRFYDMMRGYVLNRPETYLLPEPNKCKGLAKRRHDENIRNADEVLIFNVGGYIGEDTQQELRYAEWFHGKRVEYLEPEKPFKSGIAI